MATGAEPLSYWDYLKAAFAYRPKVPLLGRMPVNPLALGLFGVLGIANPGFLFLGGALEAAYLLTVSSNKRFQKFVDAERLAAQKKVYDNKLQQSVYRLSQASQDRYFRLLEQCRAVVGISATLDGGSLESVQSLRAGGLNQLLSIFLRLLTSREVLSQNMVRSNREVMEAEIERLEANLAETPESSQLRRSIQGTLEIQRKRLENFDKAQNSLRVIDAELQRIEQQVVLIREETAVGGKAAVLSDRLDSVTSTLTETNRWMEQHAEIIGDLGGAPLEASPGVLPTIPPNPVETEGGRNG